MKFLEPDIYKEEIEDLVARAVAYNEIIGLRGADGNAVLMSEEEYDALMETVHVMRDPRVAQDILEAAGELLDECIAEEDVEW